MRTLTQRERAFLLMATGQRSLAEISKVLSGNEVEMAAQLLAKGFIEKPTVPALDDTESKTGTEPVQLDAFEGKRSLAATRMYLFDMSERIFSRKDPELADRLRNSLREARDRDSMLAVSREMLGVIERIAGDERAAKVRERITLLLPPEVGEELVC